MLLAYRYSMSSDVIWIKLYYKGISYNGMKRKLLLTLKYMVYSNR